MIILNHVTHKYSELVTIIVVIAETDYSDQEELVANSESWQLPE